MSYLELGQFSALLENARENPELLLEILNQIVGEVDSPMEAAELRGQTARILEAYPNNPALLLIRSLAEAFCRDSSSEIVFENFIAFVNFASSPTGWGIGSVNIAELAANFINHIGDKNVELSQDLVVALTDRFSEDREFFRKLINDLNEESAYYPVQILMNEIMYKIESLLI